MRKGEGEMGMKRCLRSLAVVRDLQFRDLAEMEFR
jgi:hypothetical protein